MFCIHRVASVRSSCIHIMRPGGELSGYPERWIDLIGLSKVSSLYYEQCRWANMEWWSQTCREGGKKKHDKKALPTSLEEFFILHYDFLTLFSKFLAAKVSSYLQPPVSLNPCGFDLGGNGWIHALYHMNSHTPPQRKQSLFFTVPK